MLLASKSGSASRSGSGHYVKSEHLTEFGYSMVQCLSCEVTKYYKWGNKKGIKSSEVDGKSCGSFPEYGEGLWEN